ncbi:hypothetical protein ParKJ_37370 [Paraburkholderia fungorum]|uniref:Uncharacterized protein n=1 Tax=Paraburkholderia fungorum TaxID=134537 RepID=A0AAP5QGK8_9BURK|nr:hypothetical protein [Paraburkholderia fungorum]MDT8843111.1 hypothetical protein [Paraburkholderia fungorum]
MNSEAGEPVGSITIPKSAEGSKRENDGFVRFGVDVVFHLDVLKPPLPKGNVSDGAPGANTRKQMSLELEDWW